MSAIQRILLTLLSLVTLTNAHVVEQIYSSWSETETGWQLEVQFDAGYAIPATRDDPFEPPLTRTWLLAQPPTTWQNLQNEAQAYLQKMVIIQANGRQIDSQISFPDWDHSPPDFPKLINGIAYFRAVITGDQPGRIAIGVGEGDFPKLIVENNSKFLVLDPGQSKDLRQGQRWFIWIKEGYRHVIPEGLDHVLFVIGLFFYRRKFWELFHQSLAFTVAHTFTLALAAAGAIAIPATWSGPLEIGIALSLILIALENLRPERKLKLRLLLVFLLGLLHGLGFAGALANYIDRQQLIASVGSLNLGVELAQITLLMTAWLLTLKWHQKPAYEKVRWAGSILVALAGAFWALTRLLQQLA